MPPPRPAPSSPPLPAPSPGARRSPLTASGNSLPATARHARAAIHRPAKPSPSPRGGCLSSRPARPSATPSTHSVARAVARNPRPVVAASAAPAYAFAIGASRCTGPEDPAFPYRSRLVDRWSDPRGQRPPAIRFAPSAHAPSSARRRPPRRLDQGEALRKSVFRHTCGPRAQSRAEIESPRARVPYRTDTRIANDDTPSLTCAYQVSEPLPACLRSPPTRKLEHCARRPKLQFAVTCTPKAKNRDLARAMKHIAQNFSTSHQVTGTLPTNLVESVYWSSRPPSVLRSHS